MSHLPKKLFFLSVIIILFIFSEQLFSQAVYATGENIGDFDLNKFNMSRRVRIDEAEKGNTIVERDGVTQGLLGSAVGTGINWIVCTDENPKYCNQKETAMGTVMMAMGSLYANPPASGILYAYDLLQNAGFLAKPAYAQGVGFAGIATFLPFWKVTRNLAYAMLTLVMIAIGFMIIFRMKIDPKTVISVQAALPKIVLTLVIITFSYPIVGFLIDIMYLAMGIGISMVVSAAGGIVGNTSSTKLQEVYMTAGALDLFGAVFWPAGAILKSLFWTVVGGTAPFAGIYALQDAILTLPFIPLAGISPLIVGIPALIVVLILVLGLLFTFIRLFLLLLNSYIQILISLILGPLVLLGEAIPGRSVFVGWIQNILANLVVFPATAIIIIFSVWLAVQGQAESPAWSPPFVGWYSAKSNAHALLALGLILIAPTLVAKIKKAFHPKPIIPITAGTAFAPLTGSLQTGMGAMSQFYYLKMSGGSLPIIGKYLGGGEASHPR